MTTLNDQMSSTVDVLYKLTLLFVFGIPDSPCYLFVGK